MFRREQGVDEAEEIDGLDPLCRHYLARLDGDAVGTARTRTLANGDNKIERVAVLKPLRGTGIGQALKPRLPALKLIEAEKMREDLWRLLCAITLRKVREHARFHLRQKRGVDREITGMDIRSVAAAPGPLPDEAVAIAEEFERLLGSLDKEDRRIVEFKLQELSNLEVADALGCSERTVRRHLNRLRDHLEQAFLAA